MPTLRILAAVDFSAIDRRTAEVAAQIARRRRAHLTLLHVDRMPDLVAQARARTPADVWDALIRDRTASCDQLLGEIARSLEGVEVGVEVRLALPPVEAHDGIVDSAARGGHGLVVLGPHRLEALPRPSLASAPFEVARLAPCPVLIVCERRARVDDAGFRRPLIAAPVKPWFDQLASVTEIVSAHDWLPEVAGECTADELLDRAHRGRHDLVVIGRRGLPDASGFRGTTVAMRLIESADVSLAVIP